MITVRRSEERGRLRMGWLDSHHTFSFGEYYDPQHMGFGDLRVINEDRVRSGQGFSPHGHRNMEIVSYVVSGALAHRDSTGGGGVIRPDDVQVMSAGRGIRHSEMNGSETEPVHFLQIWILPAQAETEPAYRERRFERREGLTTLVSPDGADGSLPIGQDASIRRLLAAPGARHDLTVERGRAWVQVVAGELQVDGETLRAGDGAGITDTERFSLVAGSDVEALLFDLR